MREGKKDDNNFSSKFNALLSSIDTIYGLVPSTNFHKPLFRGYFGERMRDRKVQTKFSAMTMFTLYSDWDMPLDCGVSSNIRRENCMNCLRLMKYKSSYMKLFEKCPRWGSDFVGQTFSKA